MGDPVYHFVLPPHVCPREYVAYLNQLAGIRDEPSPEPKDEKEKEEGDAEA